MRLKSIFPPLCTVLQVHGWTPSLSRFLVVVFISFLIIGFYVEKQCAALARSALPFWWLNYGPKSLLFQLADFQSIWHWVEFILKYLQIPLKWWSVRCSTSRQWTLEPQKKSISLVAAECELANCEESSQVQWLVVLIALCFVIFHLYIYIHTCFHPKDLTWFEGFCSPMTT